MDKLEKLEYTINVGEWEVDIEIDYLMIDVDPIIKGGRIVAIDGFNPYGKGFRKKFPEVNVEDIHDALGSLLQEESFIEEIEGAILQERQINRAISWGKEVEEFIK